MEPLTDHGVKVLADIRLSPRSRIPAFSKPSISGGCNAHGLQYVHINELGNVNKDGQMGTGTVLKDAVKGINQLDIILKEFPDQVAIMCACRDHRGCHRRDVVNLLINQRYPDLEVINL